MNKCNEKTLPGRKGVRHSFAVPRLFSCMLIVLSIVACPSLAQQKSRISLSFTNKPLKEVLASIEAQSGYLFNYAKSEVNVGLKITVKVQEQGIEAALKAVFSTTPYQYTMEGRLIILEPKPQAAQPVNNKKAPGRIAGKLIDEQNGEPVINATVRIGNTATVTGLDGSFMLSLAPGKYMAKFSSAGYVPKEVEGILIKAAQTFQLQVTLKRAKGELSAVVVRASARKESIASLFARQKNAPAITNGISAEQISRTPDKNIGESLKRISGVSSQNDRYVVVRGIGERYNQAALDGTLLPSTEAQSRNFSFDLIPSNLVENVVVVKTVTPDMNASFGGGMIQVNTKDIPAQNFTSISAGISYNDLSTGRDFYSRKRGSYDFAGFDDGHRGDFPDQLQQTGFNQNSLPAEEFQQRSDEQSKRFNNHDNFTMYRYRAMPSQNYQLTLARVLHTDTTGQRLGLTASLSYRNSQNIQEFSDFRRGSVHYDSSINNHGAIYGFNTTLGALLNIGWQTGKHRFSFRNLYTRMFDNATNRMYFYHRDEATDNLHVRPQDLQEVDDPTFTDLLQNKLSGQHQLRKLKLEWNIARTGIRRAEKDVIFTQAGAQLLNGKYFYFYSPGSTTEIRDLPMSRSNYTNVETHYSGDISASIPFTWGKTRHTFKTGYAATFKQAQFDWRIVAMATDSRSFADSLRYLPVGQWGNPEHIGATGFNYSINPWYIDYYKGKNQTHAGFVMLDNRLLDELRLVWGLRAEYFEYKELNNPPNSKEFFFESKPEQKWRFMPSANLTFNPIESLNLRASWSNSVVRPELMENGKFMRYSPYYNGTLHNYGITSTRITSYDIKAEWFPGAGEIISAGAFYKYFDQPVELVANLGTGNMNYILQNSKWAKVYGLEFEMRKHLGFLANKPFLSNLYVYSNLTVQTSDVQSSYKRNNLETRQEETIDYKQERALYGQVPFLFNAGLQFTGEHFGWNIVYNAAGYKTNIVSDNPSLMEYERPRGQLDAQISYRLLRKKMELKLNAGNILNTAFRFYKNQHFHENAEYDKSSYDWNDRFSWNEGYSDKYEDGDLLTMTRYIGRSFSFSVSYNF